MWLPASYSNHDPGWIATYFLETVSHVGGYPGRVRTDCGTENVTLQQFSHLSRSAHPVICTDHLRGINALRNGGRFFIDPAASGGFNGLGE